MLLQLLRALDRTEQPRTETDLAGSLGVTPQMLLCALEECTRMGYVRHATGCSHDTPCSGGCAGCTCRAPQSSSEKIDKTPGPSWWELTAKGRGAIARRDRR